MVAEDNPILVRRYRSSELESLHRGAWVLVDETGTVLDGAGDPDQLVFARSATKSLQAVPFVDHVEDIDPRSMAIAIASHDGDRVHVDAVEALLASVGLDAHDLRCGPQPPRGGGLATRIRNNCSGKHAAFLALAVTLGEDPATYLEPLGRVQTLVREAVAQGTGWNDLGDAVDGCGAPSFHLPLRNLALGLARVAQSRPEITTAAATHPELVGGSSGRLDTDLLRATRGRVFPKVGAEGVYALGLVGGARGLAVKIDDGAERGLHRLVIDALHRHGLLGDRELAELDQWYSPVIRNWAGDPVGAVELA